MTLVPPRNLACRQLYRYPEVAHWARGRAGTVASTQKRNPQETFEHGEIFLKLRSPHPNLGCSICKEAHLGSCLPPVPLWSKNKAFGEDVFLALGTFILTPGRTWTMIAAHMNPGSPRTA